MTHDDDILRGDGIAEAELVDALTPVAPEWDDFEKRVREKIERGDAAPRQLPRWLKFAAGVVPPGALEANAVVAAGAKGSLKAAAPALLAAPLISVVMLVLTFVAVVRSLGPMAADRSDGTEKTTTLVPIGDWWRAHYLAAFCGCLAFVIATIGIGANGLILVMLASMVGFVFVLRQISAMGFADRVNVGSRAFLFQLMLGCFVMQLQFAHDDRWAALVLMLGGLVAAVTSGMIRVRWRRSKAVVVMMLLAMLPALGLTLYRAVGRPLPAPAEVRTYLERFGEFENSAHWREFAVVAREFTAAGGAFEAEEAVRHARGSSNGYVQLFALESGIVSAADFLETGFNPRERGWTLSRTGPIRSLRQKYCFLLRLADDPLLTDEERAHVVERLDATWPDLDAPGDLRVTRLVCDLLGVYGAEDRVDARAASIRASLARLEGAPKGRDQGGFRSYFGDSLIDGDGTMNALWLIERVGVPEGFDAFGAHRTLDKEARRQWLGHDVRGPSLVAAASLQALRRVAGEPRRGIVRALGDEHLTLGSLLLVLLCLWAIWRAPVVEPDRSQLTR